MITSHATTIIIINLAITLIVLNVAREVLLCLAELTDHADNRSNFSSEWAIKKWYASSAILNSMLLGFFAGAIVASISIGWLAGIAAIFVWAVLMRPRLRTVRLVKRRWSTYRIAR